jgi:hypothetical protein
VKQAFNSDSHHESKEATRRDEILNMINYNVGHFTRRDEILSSSRKNILRAFMFLKNKTKPDGSYDKTKVRLVANGAQQAQNTYHLILSSTIHTPSVMLLLNITSRYKAKAVSYDEKGAFLDAKFEPDEKRIYLVISAENAAIFDPTAAEFVDERGELVLELDKYVYGLKQSPYKFMQHIRQVLLDTGYKQNSHDECLYYKRSEQGFSILSIHMDYLCREVLTLKLSHYHSKV